MGNFKVLLISLVNWDSLIEVPAMLADGTCEVDVFCVKDSWAIQNSVFKKWIEAPTDQNAFVDDLLKYIELNGEDYQWIIPGDDVIIRLLNEVLDDEKRFYQLMPLTDINFRSLLGSKAGFSNLCRQHGITTPRYLVYYDGLTNEAIIEQMGFPFLLKLDKSEGGYGVFLCENAQDLNEQMSRIKDKTNMVFQQFIKGYDVNVEVLYRHGNLLVYNYSRTTRIMGKFGVSTERVFYPNNEVEQDLLKIGKEWGLSGFGNVVFMYSEADKKHYLIEVDVRPNAWMYYGKFTGNNFSEAIRKMTQGDLTLLRQYPTFIGKQTTINLYKKDVYRCIIEKDLKGGIAWFTGKNNRKAYIPRHDKKLLAACNRYLWQSFKELANSRLRKMVGKKS